MVLPKVSDASHVQALALLLTQWLPVGGIGVDAQIEDARGLRNVDAIAAVDGPNLKVRDVEAFRRVAGRSAAHGYDGKWVSHPDEIAAGNEIFSPRQNDYDHAELILEAYDWHTSGVGGGRGAVMLSDEMIDEASRNMALAVAAKGRTAGVRRQSGSFVPPEGADRWRQRRTFE